MRAFALITVAIVITSCKRDAARNEPAPTPIATTNAAPTQAAPAPAVPTPSVQVEYQKPQDPAHQRLYGLVQERQVLEHVAEVLSAVRLPATLTLVFKGCDGDSNAYYEEETHRVVFCYEYLADIERLARKNVKKNQYVSLQDATDGPVAFVLFHEAGHAVYHLLKVPVLGKEEDAADFFAAAALLRLGNDVAMRYLRGAAWAYKVSAQKTKLDVSDFSDSHSLDSQRYYNILCMAYGSDPKYFEGAITRGKLPPERAQDCGWEWRHARYALQKLVLPSIDQQQLEYVRMKHKAKLSQPSPASR